MIGDDETNFPDKLLLKLMQIICQQILSYQKLNYLR